MIPIERQIKCIEREIALRKRVYPKLVGSERMTTETAKEEVDVMQAVLETLKTHNQGTLL